MATQTVQAPAQPRRQQSVADGAAPAITVEPAVPATLSRPVADDGSHTPPHGDALAGTLFEHAGQ